MSACDRLLQLTAHLQAEIQSARAGSTRGQFPILDLIGSLRNEASARSELTALAAVCVGAWKRVARSVESGQPFSADDVSWLQDLLAQVESLAGGAGASATGTGLSPDLSPAVNVSSPAIPPEGINITVEEAPLNLNLAADADLLREFITESREHLDNIERGLLVLEHSPSNAEVLNTIFRAFHTFKGGAAFLNLVPINRLAHVLESLLDLARQGRLMIHFTFIELILRGRDVLKKFLDEIEGQLSGKRPQEPVNIPIASLITEVRELIRDNRAALEDRAADTARPMSAPATHEPVAHATVDNTPAGKAPAEVDSDSARANGAAAVAAMVKVNTAKLDSLLDLVGEMVIAQSLVGQNLRDFAGSNPQVQRNVAQLGRVTRELQRVSMALRMVPIRGVFQKMSRVARDIGAKLQKQVNFTTCGEDTELDRTVVEELNDPLLHMIRNAMDHGIESPEIRVASGKPAAGCLTLRACHQGGNIVVEIEDDGAGLNRDRILKRAIERGLAREGEPLADEEIFQFIFAAGFSTAEKITELSGRGVGLDVARRNIERLRGRIEISSRPALGTKFKISLPLTLAIIDGFIVQVGPERYILPTLSVRESFRPQPGMITRVQNRAEVVNVRGRIVPLVRLDEVFGVSRTSRDASGGIVVVVQAGADLRGLLVDEVSHKQEVVIRNLNEMLVHKNQLLAGAAILGDGQVGLILDVNALVHQQARSQATRTA